MGQTPWSALVCGEPPGLTAQVSNPASSISYSTRSALPVFARIGEVYIPEHFRENNETVLRQFVAAHSFGVLVTNGGQDLIATHLPLLLEGETIVGHVARPNGQARDLESGCQAMAVFSGPHAYISPSLYAQPQINVPTWNYTAVHVYGKPSIISEPSEVAKLLLKMVSVYESGRAMPWTFDADAAYIQNMMRAIVAFKIPIERMEGKFKLSQNRPIGDRGRVMWSLKDSESQADQELGKWMEKLF